MSTEAALLRAIRETPEEDAARLVYADFLEEEGDPARGEFVRVQVALAGMPDGDPRRPALEDREHELLAENEARWLGAPPDAAGLVGWRFERGFVEELAATPYFMLGPGADVCAAHPVRRWRVQADQDNMPQDLLDCGRRGWFARLEAVDLAGWYQSVGELERFLTRSDFGRLRELDLSDEGAARPGLDDLPGILERAPFREQLKVLRCGGGGYPGEAGRLDAWELTRALAPARLAELALPGCLLTAEDVRGLLAGDCCRVLAALDIRDNPIEPEGWEAFRTAKCRLRSLDLSGTPLGGAALGDVLRCESVVDLRVLNINRCAGAAENLRALAASRFWAQAEELRMRQGTGPDGAMGPLFASPGPPGLRVLDASGTFLRDDGVAALCATRWSDTLTDLDLSQNYLSDEAIRTIASCGRLSRLRTLHLSRNDPPFGQEGADLGGRITDAGLVALAESPSLANLRRLDVSGTDVMASGIDALLNGPHWRLTGLGLAASNTPEEVVRVIADSVRLARLMRLDLSNNYAALSADALMPLAESEYLSPLCELNITGCLPDPEVRDALRARLGRRLRADQ